MNAYLGWESIKSLLDKISYENLERQITSLENANFSTLSLEEVCKKIDSIIYIHPLHCRPLALMGMYRARKNEKNQVFINVKDLWYPPESIIKNFGRLNEVRQSRFYAADTINASFYELNPTIDDIFTILTVRTKTGGYLTLSKVVFLGIENSKSDKLVCSSPTDKLRDNPTFINHIGNDNYKKWQLVDNYFHYIITQKVLPECEYKYKPTVALANRIFSNLSVDAINYPSVATNCYGINICMLRTKVDEYFIPSEVWMIRVVTKDIVKTAQKTEEILPRIEFLKKSSSISSKGEIEWRAEQPTQEEIKVYLSGHKIHNLSSFPKPYKKP